MRDATSNPESDWQARKATTLGNWRMAPFSRWSFQHTDEMVPSARITSALQRDYEYAPALPPLDVKLADGSTFPLTDFLAKAHADSLVIMREGNVIHEWHADHVDPRNPHLIFSVSKSVTGMLAGIAVADGLLDPDALASTYVPVKPGSAYEEARVRDLLDMTVDLKFEEDYLDLGGVFDRYRRAMLWNPEREDTVPETMEELLGCLERDGDEHGMRFFYASPNTDMLGLVIERAVGQRLHHFMRKRLWLPMGARDASFVTVDRAGTARTAGGMCVTARDLALLGQTVMDGGKAPNGHQVLPSDWISDMREKGDRQAWLEGNFVEMLPDGDYRSCWYNVRDENDCFCCVGIHGQYLWCDPQTRTVIARMSSHPEPNDEAVIADDLSVLGQIARSV